jgi:hypothetical protein
MRLRIRSVSLHVCVCACVRVLFLSLFSHDLHCGSVVLGVCAGALWVSVLVCVHVLVNIDSLSGENVVDWHTRGCIFHIFRRFRG